MACGRPAIVERVRIQRTFDLSETCRKTSVKNAVDCWVVANACLDFAPACPFVPDLIGMSRIDLQRTQTATCIGPNPRTVPLIHVHIELSDALEIGVFAEVQGMCPAV